MQNQKELLIAMQKDFGITRKIFLNLKTGWYDRSKGKSNLVNAEDITIEPIQGRYRLNMNDNLEKVQEFYFDIEWSPFTKDGKEIKPITKEIVNLYLPRLKRVAKKVLFILLKYIPKENISIRISGTGLHIIFFAKGLSSMDEWMLITKYIIFKSKLPNTKNADKLVFGLDRDTILSSDRKIAEFGSWNKLKKDFKEEVDYLNYATYISVKDFFAVKDYPFCGDYNSVKYPDRYKEFPIPVKLLQDVKNANLGSIEDVKLSTNSITANIQTTTGTELSKSSGRLIVEYKGQIPEDDPAYRLISHCKCYWNMLRDANATWYARQFLVKYLKYVLKLDREQILKLIDKYTAWSDYNPRITAFYVNKHFRKGTCETKVQKPPRKKTLVKYGLCDNKCEECVYHIEQTKIGH